MEISKIGTLAQLVEQRTENPCVPGSIPGGTTKNPLLINDFQGVLFFDVMEQKIERADNYLLKDSLLSFTVLEFFV